MRRLAVLLLLGVALFGCQGRESVVAPEATVSGTIESADELAAAADIPLYPDAALPEGKSNIKSLGSEKRYEIIMSTPDLIAKVKEFYVRTVSLEEIAGTQSLMGRTDAGAFLQVDMERIGEETIITAVSVREVE